ncbi:MAG: hypothetical protein JSS59_03305 [Proteobacteria bacterium]|uniref:hypothetical protein n=1 Tax=Rudaea sp. TaxID=2136325 RepID=UPI00378368D1|nr:hypothetical protein [Pseudomonadota bacterium]
MKRLLLFTLAVFACNEALASADDFRCFKSIDHQPPIRLQIDFADAKGGYVTYERGKGKIPVALTEDKVIRATRDRPNEGMMRWKEDATVGAGGEYVMVSQGARVSDFRYIRKTDGKVFHFEEDLQASGENACTWNK